MAEDDPSPHDGPDSVRGGAYLGLPTVSVPPQDAQAHFGWIGHFFGMAATASNTRTREQLSWTPAGPTLFDDIAAGAYAGANIALAA